MKASEGQDIDYKPTDRVQTPSGRIGVVIKTYGAESKYGHIERVIVRFCDTKRDTVALQPQLLKLLPDLLAIV